MELVDDPARLRHRGIRDGRISSIAAELALPRTGVISIDVAVLIEVGV